MERDIEQIIKSVAEEVYQKLQAQGGAAPMAAAPVAAGNGCHKILARMNPSMKIDDVKAACEDAKRAGVCALCIPQWFVDYACGQLKGTNIKVATVVGLPQGTTSTFAKYAEVKLAVQAGCQVRLTLLLFCTVAVRLVGAFPTVMVQLPDAFIPALVTVQV